MSHTPPETLIIGMIDGQWPVQAFTVDAHALAWFQDGTDRPGNRRRLWRVTLTDATPLAIVPAVPARLVNKELDEPTEPSP